MNDVIVKRLWVFFLLFVIGFFVVHFMNMKPYEEKYSGKIAFARSLLTDDYSKSVFDELIKFNANKTPMTENLMDKFPENFCPQVPLNKGDTMINGGISTDLTLTFKLADAVGEKGEILGFEPNNRIIEKINKEIKDSGYKNIKTYPVGLWNKNCYKDLFIKEDVDASLVYNNSNGAYLPAKLVALDKFIVEKNIQKINFITLDVEGAEMQALKGSETILFTQKPNLAISIHHRATDAFEVIEYLNKLNCGYKFWLGYHAPYSPTMTNVILYATAK